jgi:hypothetical protein
MVLIHKPVLFIDKNVTVFRLHKIIVSHEKAYIKVHPAVVLFSGDKNRAVLCVFVILGVKAMSYIE